MIDILVFDLETTGVDVHTDRIVTAYVGLMGKDGEIVREQEWIVNPGVPVPEGAAAVHGWTDERLASDPRVRKDLDAVVYEIAHLIYSVTGMGYTPLGGHNLAFDLTMLNAHLDRAGIARLPFGVGGIKVLDSIVLDKHYVRYLKGAGQRKLVATANRYGIPLTEADAHDASFDAKASGRIIQAILAQHVANVTINPEATVAYLHQQQIGWRATQQIDLQKWLRKGTDPAAVCETGWPTHNHPVPERTAA